jgi:hypothetical protein
VVRSGRFARIPTVGQVQAIVDAPTLGPAPPAVHRELAKNWPVIADALLTSLVRRQQERAESLQGVLDRRADEDARAVVTVLAELERSIRAELDEATSDLQLRFSLFAADERAQAERDLDALRRRLEEIPAEAEAEASLARRRYAEPTPRLFPAAVEICVPEHMAVR